MSIPATAAPATGDRPAPHPRLEIVVVALNQSGVSWCALHVESAATQPLTSLDLLVAPDAVRTVERILAGAGFLPCPGGPRTGERAFVSFIEEDGCWAELRMSTRLAFGPWGEFATDLAPVLLRRRQTGHVATLAIEDEFWELWLHGVLGGTPVTSQYVEAARRSAVAAGRVGPLAALTSSLLPADWDADQVRVLAVEGQWEAFEPVGRHLRRVWERDPLLDAVVRDRRVRGRWFDRSGMPRQRGLMVALLAPDGAGKSTAVERLQHAIPLPTHRLYMGLYSREQPVPAVPFRGFDTLVRLLRQWRGYIDGRRHRRRGMVVVCDRYCYDARLREGEGSWLHRARTWLLGHACPAPDVTVVLDAEGALLHRRKPEHEVADLEARRQGYLVLARRFQWEVVDASREIDMVCRDLQRSVWRAWVHRHTDGRDMAHGDPTPTRHRGRR